MALGIYRTRTMTAKGKKTKKKERVADFSYRNEDIAQLIVDAWTNQSFRNQLLSNRGLPNRSLPAGTSI